jgi:NADH dehydrogenase/NADH:ubiquinone oxidoreductase subunit G
MDKAHLVLSAASFAESDGTVINNEGRAHMHLLGGRPLGPMLAHKGL